VNRQVLIAVILAAPLLRAQAPTEVAPGIFAFTPNNTTDGLPDGNATVIIGSKAVLVVDAPSVRLSREHLRWIQSKTSLPVRYVVNTHWHLDHMSGNQVYADQFPGVEIIASGETRDLSIWRNPSTLAQQQALNPNNVAAARKQTLQSHATPYEAAHVLEALDKATREWPVWRETHLVQPTLTFEGEMDLDLGDRHVQLRKYVGHTTGDVVALIPEQGVLVTGDLVVAPVPYAFTSHFREWSESLARLMAIDGVKTIVPGHGPVLSSWDYVRSEKALIDTLLSQVRSAMHAGFTEANQVDSVTQHVDLSQFAAELAGNDPARQWAFKNYFLIPAIPHAFDELRVESF
jgi:glyoxylase-like metal-dependent hydrolase (beta-lactamase superfamily II)